MRHVTFYMVLVIAAIIMAAFVMAAAHEIALINSTTVSKDQTKWFYDRIEPSIYPEATAPPTKMMRSPYDKDRVYGR